MKQLTSLLQQLLLQELHKISHLSQDDITVKENVGKETISVEWVSADKERTIGIASESVSLEGPEYASFKSQVVFAVSYNSEFDKDSGHDVRILCGDLSDTIGVVRSAILTCHKSQTLSKNNKTLPGTLSGHFNTLRAEKEGWTISFTGNDDSPVHNRYELQRMDEDGIFSNDDEAIRFVVEKALLGVNYYVAAIRFLVVNSPNEVDSIIRTAVGSDVLDALLKKMNLSL